MFNLFNNKKVPNKNIVEEDFHDNTINKIVKEKKINSSVIKKDMNSSFELLLEQNNILLSSSYINELEDKLATFKEANKHIYDKINMSDELGLQSTPITTSLEEDLNKQEQIINNEISKCNTEIERAKEIKLLNNKYSKIYPGYKFIPTEVMVKICKDYNLFLGDSCLYAKEIPDNHLNIIYNFKDKIKFSTKYIYEYFDSWGDKCVKVASTDPTKMKSTRVNTNNILELKLSNFKMVAPLSHFNLLERDVEGTKVNLIEIKSENNEIKLNMTSYHKALSKFNAKNNPKDPIACLQVDGGYIIMTAWDEEAKIPEIQNTNLN